MTVEALHDEYMSVPEIAALLGCNLTQAHNITRRHGFPAALMVFNRPVFPRADVTTFLANERVSARTAKGKRKRAA